MADKEKTEVNVINKSGMSLFSLLMGLVIGAVGVFLLFYFFGNYNCPYSYGETVTFKDTGTTLTIPQGSCTESVVTDANGNEKKMTCCTAVYCTEECPECKEKECDECIPLGQSCSADKEGCCEGECNSNYVCEKPETCEEKGGYCSTSEDCCEGLSCTNGVCSTSCMTSGACTSDNDCCSPYLCLNGYCGTKPECKQDGATCTYGSECCYGDCIDGVCLNCGIEGSSCTYDNDCCEGACNSNNICGAEECSKEEQSCETSEDCCDYLTCSDGVCETPCMTSGPCTSNDDCCSPYVCGANNYCTIESCKYTGQSCTSDNDCCSNLFCLDGVCGSCGESGEYCAYDGDCCSGLVCDLQTQTCGIEEACKEITETCTYDSDCCSNFCSGGVCKTPCTTSGSCTSNDDCCSPYICGANNYCTVNTCKAYGSTCTASSECCDPYDCRSTGTCGTCSNEGGYCGYNGDCCIGYSCNMNLQQCVKS